MQLMIYGTVRFREVAKMIDVYVGIVGEPKGMLELEFDSFKEASEFCDSIKDHFKRERNVLYVAIDNTDKKGEYDAQLR